MNKPSPQLLLACLTAEVGLPQTINSLTPGSHRGFCGQARAVTGNMEIRNLVQP
jgi:hypothetical protein